MKKTLTILLLLAFILQSTSQYWVLLSFKLNQEYIATNLCINRFEAIPLCKGSCFLEKQIKETEKQQQKVPDLKNKEITAFFWTEVSGVSAFTLFDGLKTQYFSGNADLLPSPHSHSIFRPPITTG